ncbi:MAG: ABC transporter ATP-binding protein [Spirochaetales bacterium]|jgi:ABC-type nitrate/sulfonate/bicarbonate transport system ATPase subunit|nr:ABC transporter ATP-binding protein [Spirochaetales bacterium]
MFEPGLMTDRGVEQLRASGLSRTFRGSALGRDFSRGEVHAVRGFDLDVSRGSFTVIAGPSGCGKTTLLKLLAGLEKPDAGEVIFAGDADGPPKPRFGFMFQDARLLPWLTVEENLLLAFPPRSGQKAREEIARTLSLVGLDGWKDAYPRKLSGGMAQRAALARALCRKPQILLLDEPFGALDAFTRSRLRQELDQLWRDLAITVILVTHDIEEAVFFADRVILMISGELAGEIPIDLPRPRSRRARDFQACCSLIESAIGGEEIK